MKAKKPLLCGVLLAFVLALAFAPAALAKSQPVTASGNWTWVGGEGGTNRVLAGDHLYIKGYEIGQWTGTFTATDTYENFVAMVLFDPADPETLALAAGEAVDPLRGCHRRYGRRRAPSR